MNRMTDRCKNIPFLQLLLRTVKNVTTESAFKRKVSCKRPVLVVINFLWHYGYLCFQTQSAFFKEALWKRQIYDDRKQLLTRKHSSRMRTVRWGGGVSSEQVWTGLHCWPPDFTTNLSRGWSQIWCPVVPYHVAYPIMHLMLPNPPPPRPHCLWSLIKQTKICLL